MNKEADAYGQGGGCVWTRQCQQVSKNGSVGAAIGRPPFGKEWRIVTDARCAPLR